jgi:hypothetical protein
LEIESLAATVVRHLQGQNPDRFCLQPMPRELWVEEWVGRPIRSGIVADSQDAVGRLGRPLDGCVTLSAPVELADQGEER